MFKMQKSYLVAVLFVFSFSLANVGLAIHQENTTNYNDNPVTSITLSGEGASINWSTQGYSTKGFKVSWSKNSGPTYPTRSGDKYHYHSSPSKSSDTLTAFSGDGTYYVRVCEYSGGVCGVYSNEITVVLGSGSSGENTTTNSPVTSIILKGEGNKINWATEGYSANGFKVSWSKNEHPTYPTRSGDKYQYHSSSNQSTATLIAFSGEGIYYVRVCEYLGGACGVYSNEIVVKLSDGENSDLPETVSNITLSGEGAKINWITTGYSTKGFKVAWSKNSGPTYPTRPGDKYHYRSGAKTTTDFLTAFDGAGEYYVRVCEYLGGRCGVYSNEIKVTLGEDKEIIEIKNKAKSLADNKLDTILQELRELRSIVKEQEAQIKYLKRLSGEIQQLADKMEKAINDFVAYGVDENTQKLGPGERAAVIYSYKQAYNKLPDSEDEMADVIKIASGRWPTKLNKETEDRAKKQFEKIYKKIANMDNPHDNAAITVMAYGLRQKAKNRNLDTERQGIKIFMDIYGYHPSTTEDWNIMQAIAYSGSKRGIDTDKDLLIDERELFLGTDPYNPDTDGDGHLDGMEVANGFDPLNK